MSPRMNRRQFIQLTAAGSMAYLGAQYLNPLQAQAGKSSLISPGCRGTKVKVARLYMGTSHGLWPKPNLNFEQEIRKYESKFTQFEDELDDIEFVIDELVTDPEQVKSMKSGLQNVDGILAIHFNIGVRPILEEILSAGRPTMVFAIPYSGHEWVQFGELQNQVLGAHMGCMLTSDFNQLALALRPFRAIHHLREAKILNLTTRNFEIYASEIQNKFGTKIQTVTMKRVVDTYNSIDDKSSKRETDRWVSEAIAVVEPSRQEIFNSCKLALALEKLLKEENATVMTVDCYGTMYEPFCRKYAYPCVGFTRLNNLGLGGICESDLQAAITHIIMQGLTGKPGFISDPTVDESDNSIILAHCLGTTRMDGPEGPAAPYKLRSIMERQEGVVPQVQMRLGEKVTQAKLVGTDFLPYFTGTIIDVPESDRGCRTKITVKVDGDTNKLWKNWTSGLHRSTCYGDIREELAHFCRFKDIEMVDEAA